VVSRDPGKVMFGAEAYATRYPCNDKLVKIVRASFP